MFKAADKDKSGYVSKVRAYACMLRRRRISCVHALGARSDMQFLFFSFPHLRTCKFQEEFCELAGPLCARSFSRVAVYKFVNTVGGKPSDFPVPTSRLAGDAMLQRGLSVHDELSYTCCPSACCTMSVAPGAKV